MNLSSEREKSVIVSGVIKYTCINQTENKTYNVVFSFANEFISDYPNCLYDIKSELNIQAITPCRIYICSSELLLQEFEENKKKSTNSPHCSRTIIFSVVFTLLGFVQIYIGKTLSPTS